MIAIREVFNRVQWDAAPAQGSFVLARYVRVDDKLIRLRFGRVQHAG